jgi:ribosomal-protein-alanine N-acetyltransferase
VIALRSYLPEDFEACWQLDQRCFPSGIAYSKTELRFYMRLPEAFAIVAEDEDRRLCGFIVAHLNRRMMLHIITIDTEQAARRSGLGTRLMRAAEDRAIAQGAKSVMLEVAVDNESAISFYKRLGFQVVRTIPRYYQGALDALVMRRELGTVSVV